MKNLKVTLAALLAVAALATSCKKGEDDPAISLKSRDSRLTGEWKLVKIEGTETGVAKSTSVSSSTTIITDEDASLTTTFDGTTYKEVAKAKSVSTFGSTTSTTTWESTYTGTYSLEMNITDDGNMTTTSSNAGKTVVYTETPAPATAPLVVPNGTASIAGVSIQLLNTNGTYTYPVVTNNNTGTGSWNWANSFKNKSVVQLSIGTFYVKELRSKTLVLVQMGKNGSTGTAVTNSSSNSDSNENTTTWTFEAK